MEGFPIGIKSDMGATMVWKIFNVTKKEKRKPKNNRP
jgi:hypothetical protein